MCIHSGFSFQLHIFSYMHTGKIALISISLHMLPLRLFVNRRILLGCLLIRKSDSQVLLSRNGMLVETVYHYSATRTDSDLTTISLYMFDIVFSVQFYK